MTLPYVLIFECSVFVHNNLDKFQFKERARNEDKLCLVLSKTTLVNNSILCKTPQIYNEIRLSIRTIGHVNVFKKNLRKLLSKCYYSLSDFLCKI